MLSANAVYLHVVAFFKLLRLANTYLNYLPPHMHAKPLEDQCKNLA